MEYPTEYTIPPTEYSEYSVPSADPDLSPPTPHYAEKRQSPSRDRSPAPNPREILTTTRPMLSILSFSTPYGLWIPSAFLKLWLRQLNLQGVPETIAALELYCRTRNANALQGGFDPPVSPSRRPPEPEAPAPQKGRTVPVFPALWSSGRSMIMG